jgi:hypothetical protein
MIRGVTFLFLSFLDRVYDYRKKLDVPLPSRQDEQAVAREEWRPLRIDWLDPKDESAPEVAVVFFPTDRPYTVSVELRYDPDGAPFVLGVAIRCQYPSWEEWQEWRENIGWPAAGTRPHVSARDIQRFPIAQIVRAALAAAATAKRPTLENGKPARSQVAAVLADADPAWREQGGRDWDWAEDARKILVPRGRPERGKSAGFYKDIAVSHRKFAAAGKSPVKEIARRKRVSENTVHQWVHRARKLKFLEPSPRVKRKDRTDG